MTRRMENLSMILGAPDEIKNETWIQQFHSKGNISDMYDLNTNNIVQLEKYAATLVNRQMIAGVVSPASVFYWYGTKQVFLPAGRVQRPSFHHEFPDFKKFSGIGFTLAHELGHALHACIVDDPLTSAAPITPFVSDWTRKNFLNLTSCVGKQYSSFEVEVRNVPSDLIVNGEQTLKENVVDILGIQISFKAFMEHGEVSSSPVHEQFPHLDFFGCDEFTKEQLFFISFAQEWCEAYESDQIEYERLTSQVRGDTHAPHSVRVMGMLANFEEFSKAFHCPVGSRYNPEEKCGFFNI
ncbi:endothelin-converting enzyme homolog [Folsomia candida]|nr:endothelin-converting enzyme homolog [Folsomia candida]